MSYIDLSFLIFLAVLTALYRLCPPRARTSFLFASSLLFYFTWSVRNGLLLLFLAGLVFFAGKLVAACRDRSSAPWLAPLICAGLVAYLMAFKVALLTPSRGIAGIVMPLGVSFYSFRMIGYILDIHWGKTEPASLPDFAAFVLFFPQMVAGPIQRAGDFFRQAPYAAAPLGQALSRLAWGLVKKLLIADNLAPAVDYVFSHMRTLHGAPLWLAFYLYPFQLYADFSGLTDIALGAGMLLGIRGPENFNRPFTASSPGDYWRRWHMSLTTWLADYLFTPLRMALREAGKAGLALSVAINMTAIGLWHGLTAPYLAFGLFHSAFLATDALTTRERSRFFKRHPEWDRAGAWLGWLLTFHIVAAGMVFFRAARLTDAFHLFGHLFDRLAGSGAEFRFVVEYANPRSFAIGLAGAVLIEAGERCRPDLWMWRRNASGPRWVRWCLRTSFAVLLVFGLILFVAHTGLRHSPFIYEIF